MFARISLNGAAEIAIVIPHEAAPSAMPALAAMLENNAVFLASAYSKEKIVKPKITFELGNELNIPSGDETIKIIAQDPSAVIAEEWQPATPEVFASNRKKLEELEQRLTSAQRKIDTLELRLQEANAKAAMEPTIGFLPRPLPPLLYPSSHRLPCVLPSRAQFFLTAKRRVACTIDAGHAIIDLAGLITQHNEQQQRAPPQTDSILGWHQCRTHTANGQISRFCH